MPAIDRYTKAVLTVIAGCLLWMCLRGTAFTPIAEAQNQAVLHVQDVRVVAVQKPTRNESPWDPVNVFTVNGH